jgi:hypothetical protein
MSDIIDNNYIRLVKTCVGSLDFELINPTTNAKQVVRLESDSKGKIMPIEWAALVYADNASGAYKLYKAGYFTFDKPNDVYEYAKTHNFIFGDIDMQPIESPTYGSDILAVLKSGTISKIDKYLDTAKHQEDLVRIARANISDIKAGTISYVEKKLNIKLQIDGE